MANSSLSAVSGSGTLPAFSNSSPLWMSSVASPPSSTICVGPRPSPKSSARSVRSQYSSSVSPFQAKTGMPFGFSGVPSGPTATAAAAWSWVEKMLHDAQRTSAPEGAQRLDQHRGLDRHVQAARDALALQRLLRPRTRARTAMRPGISCSASSDLLAAPLGEGEVGHLELEGALGGGWGSCVVVIVMSPFSSLSVEASGRARRRPWPAAAPGPSPPAPGGSGRHADVVEAAPRPAAASQLLRLEAEALLAHLAAEVVAVVAQQVDDHRAPAGPQDARHLARAPAAGSAT